MNQIYILIVNYTLYKSILTNSGILLVGMIINLYDPVIKTKEELDEIGRKLTIEIGIEFPLFYENLKK